MIAGDSLFFTDTNLLLYTLDQRDRQKQQRAEEWMTRLWSSGRGCLSWQVLHEFYVNATKKFHLSGPLTRAIVTGLVAWRPVETSLGLLERAWEWSDKAALAYWDSLIVAAAERCQAGFLLSEDFQAGRRFGGCLVLNPFDAEPADYLPAPVSLE